MKKSKNVIPAFQLKNVTNDDDVMDLELPELDCLKRYHSAFRALVTSGMASPLEKPFVEEDIGKNIQNTIVDWSANHGLQGKELIAEVQTNMSYTVLQAALILTITIPLFIDIPEFTDEWYTRTFSATMGFSAFAHMFVIIGITILQMILARPYSDADALLARVETFSLFGLVVVLNYLGVFAALFATFLAAFGRKELDGYVHFYFFIFFFFLVIWFISAYLAGSKVQDRRVFLFYKKYCDEDGQLKDEYIALLRSDLESGSEKKK